MPARWAVVFLLCAAGCKGGVPQLPESDLHPYVPAPAPCGELEGLPGRPLLAVTRKQCLAAAFATGRINSENFRARLGAYFNEISAATAGFNRTTVHTTLEPSMELLRLTEEMILAVDQQYWALRTAYAVYLCKAAAADAARELETISEKLVAAGRQSRAELEKARQTRIGHDTEREAALHGDGGLLEAEVRLRHAIGYSDCTSGLLLPADPLPVVDPAFDLCARLEYARDHRLELLTARYRIIAAEGKVIAAKKDDLYFEKEKVEHAKNNAARWEKRAAMDIQAALDRVTAASRAGALVAERRASVARQLADFEKLAHQDAFNRADLIEARIRVAAVTGEEHQAVGTYLTAVSDLDRVTGFVLNRDGVKLPSPRSAGIPRPWLTEEPHPPAVGPLTGVVRPKLDVLATGDPFAPLPQWLAPLAK
jgi:hypothetical protein